MDDRHDDDASSFTLPKKDSRGHHVEVKAKRLSEEETGVHGAFTRSDQKKPRCCWVLPIREGILAISIFTAFESLCNVVLLYIFSYEVLKPMEGLNAFKIFFVASAALTVVANTAGFVAVRRTKRVCILMYLIYMIGHLLISMGVYIFFVRGGFLSVVSAAQTPCEDDEKGSPTAGSTTTSSTEVATCTANKTIFSSFVIGFTVAFGIALLLRIFFVYETYCYYRIVKRVQKSKALRGHDARAPVMADEDEKHGGRRMRGKGWGSDDVDAEEEDFERGRREDRHRSHHHHHHHRSDPNHHHRHHQDHHDRHQEPYETSERSRPSEPNYLPQPSRHYQQPEPTQYQPYPAQPSLQYQPQQNSHHRSSEGHSTFPRQYPQQPLGSSQTEAMYQ